MVVTRFVAVLAIAMVALVTGSPGTTASAGAATGTVSNGKCSGTLEIGVGYFGDRAAAYSSFGLAAAAAGAPSDAAVQNEFNAYFNYINKHGGLNGCTAVPVYHSFHYTDPDVTAEDQSECVAFSQDTRVFFALTFWGASQCLVNAKIPELAFPGEFVSVAKSNPIYYVSPELTPVSPSPFPATVKAFAKAGFFEKGAKLGIMNIGTNQTPDPNQIALNAMKPAFKQLGVKYSLVQTTRYCPSGACLSGVAQDCTQAAIKFRGAGINEILATNTAVLLMCAQAWAAQNFSPRIGAIFSGGAVPGTGSIAVQIPFLAPKLAPDLWIGSQSVWDLGGGIVGSFSSWPAANRAKVKQCATIAGPNLASVAEGPDVSMCETMLWLQAAMKHAPSATAAGLYKGIEALGTYSGFADLWGPAKFGPGQTYGVHYIQVMKYNTTTHAYVAAGPLASV
jgi:hypothetical protein